VVAAAARSPARMRLGVDKARAGGVEQVLGEVPSNSHGAGMSGARLRRRLKGGQRRTGGRTAGTTQLEEKRGGIL
jgi:hypothetical protein